MDDLITLNLTLKELQQIDKFVEVNDNTVSVLTKIKNAYPQPKSPAEEAYKEVYGWYPPTTSSVSNYEDNRWSAFQMGWMKAQVPVEEQTKPMDEVVDRLENKYKDAEENTASYITDDVVNRMLKEWEENPPDFLKFELGKTLEELICKCMVDYNSTIPVGLLEDILNNIEEWLPDFQSHEGSQNIDAIIATDGFNDALKKIKSKLRNKK